MKNVNKAFRKKDAMQLVTGKPVYMDDLAPADCLIVKLYRSPHANAMVERIDTSVAKKVPGIEAIFTWEDVDQNARRWSRCWISTLRRTTPSLSTRRTTGRA